MAAKLPVMVNVGGWIMYAVAPRSKVPRSSPAISPTPTFCQRTVVVVIATFAFTFGVSVIVSWSTVAACAAPISPITIPAAIISFFMTCLLVWFRTSSGPAMDPSVHQSLRPGGLMEPPKCRLMSASSPSCPPAPPAHAGGVRRQVTGRGPVNRPQPHVPLRPAGQVLAGRVVAELLEDAVVADVIAAGLPVSPVRGDDLVTHVVAAAVGVVRQ